MAERLGAWPSTWGRGCGAEGVAEGVAELSLAQHLVAPRAEGQLTD